ncbi:MAG: hypothetical protein M3R00_07780, partial [Pseudomonadota bacterium]|nr:hypothetical protein [Pseudomonadota bacterium]
MTFSKKELLAQQNQQQLTYFPLSDRTTLTLHPTSWLPRATYSRTKLYLKKVEEQPSLSSKLGFVYEVDVPITQPYDHDVKLPGNADSFYWQTTQDKIQEAVDYGITEFDALTSKVIGAIGCYRMHVLERAYDCGIISNKYEQKESLLRFTQERIRNCQGLERLINSYNLGESVDTNQQNIIARFNEYIEKMEQLKLDSANLTLLNRFDRDANQKLSADIDDDILAAKTYQNTLSTDLEHTVLAATGPKSIATFIKTRMIHALREAQQHNQDITYSRNAKSFSRGQFNSYCENALRVINEHQSDHHNRVLPEHQGYFSQDDLAPITLDYQRLGKNQRIIRQFLMAITHIEGADTIARSKAKQKWVIFSENGHEHVLRTTRFTSWNIQRKKTDTVKRLLYWPYNLIVGLVVGILWDLPLGLVFGIIGIEKNTYASDLRKEIPPAGVAGTCFEKFAEKIVFPEVSLGTKLGRLLGTFVRNTLWEMVKGVAVTVKRAATLQIGKNLAIDYEIGHKGLPDESEIYATVHKDLQTLLLSKEESLQELNKEYTNIFKQPLVTSQKVENDENQGPILADEITNKRYAVAPYQLSHGEWYDLFNSTLNGTKELIDSLLHENAKHPFSGVI